jgi:hypothetical protein
MAAVIAALFGWPAMPSIATNSAANEMTRCGNCGLMHRTENNSTPSFDHLISSDE